MLKEQTRIFLDASVFIAASKSSSGGSALVLEICRGRYFQAASSLMALLEALQNIKRKFSETELVSFYQGIASLDLEISEPAAGEEFSNYIQFIDKKDAPILASAIKCHADILITLDRRHFKTEKLRKANLPITIVTPGEFIEYFRMRAEAERFDEGLK